MISKQLGIFVQVNLSDASCVTLAMNNLSATQLDSLTSAFHPPHILHNTTAAFIWLGLILTIIICQDVYK